jgi:hypothetical protein
MGTPARWLRRGAVAGFCASNTKSATASRGTLARASSASTEAGICACANAQAQHRANISKRLKNIHRIIGAAVALAGSLLPRSQ